MAKHKIHRWQYHGFTPCGRRISGLRTNGDRGSDDGVTCEACRRAKTRVILLRVPDPSFEEAT